ncbi:CPBP family intramembrane glutamic endopeptidase [Algoriphagus sp. D3-2-R+10]|uniref:CPBP family intramembrane glutamic endopeptidase n=1 Tax=Algoriphagus aurantiacus TaxID=3103948 RepID=UPI002B3B9269|nr:CPBP family intramembrane glutamic endopeptidase [Algoriphagus sp. D3-2-R+10]MEB2776666.1 CPBP family intramembrane glutamic endopeptidase [Algoriphagus sp. D3-2-R+10]
MEIYETETEIAKRKSWLLSLVVTVLVSIGVLIILQVAALALAPFLFNISIPEIMGLMTGDYSPNNGRMAMFFIQGIGSGIGFWVAAYVIMHFVDRANLHWEVQLPRFNGKGAGLVILLTIGGMLFNSLLIHLNSMLVLPEFMSGMEVWMKEMEQQLMELTEFMTDFQTIPELLTGVLVIGVLAGIGEEMFFRGLIQPKMQLYTGNEHVGIWLTAFIFSAIHVQFYGFLPRLFLGGMFGYLYYYSGSLTYPILAHIVNNTFTILLVYASNEGMIDFDVESTDTISYPVAILGLLVLLAGIFYFKKINKPNGELEQGV